MFEGPESDKPQLFTTAVTFAQQNLAPYTPQSEKFKNDLERAMALLIIPREAWQPAAKGSVDGLQAFGPLSDLVDPTLKIEVARDVNAAILKSQGRRDHSKIHRILQTRAWAEELAEEKRIDLPDLTLNIWGDDRDRSDTRSASREADTQMTEDEGTGGVPVQRYTNLAESTR